MSRLWAKTRRTPNGCLEWQGARDRRGYGVGYVNGKMSRIHRATWEAVNGPIPDGLCVCHRCDNPPCVDPEHMFLGTHADNIADRQAKGRHWSQSGDAHWSRRMPERVMRGDSHPMRRNPERAARGERVFGAKLTEEDVRKIRRMAAEGVTSREIAPVFGVGARTIRAIVAREKWRHVA